jgi:hypothetical protein
MHQNTSGSVSRDGGHVPEQGRVGVAHSEPTYFEGTPSKRSQGRPMQYWEHAAQRKSSSFCCPVDGRPFTTVRQQQYGQLSVPAWPMPTHHTKLVMSQASLQFCSATFSI